MKKGKTLAKVSARSARGNTSRRAEEIKETAESERVPGDMEAGLEGTGKETTITASEREYPR